MRKSILLVIITIVALHSGPATARPPKPPVIDPAVFGATRIATVAVSASTNCLGLPQGTEPRGVELPSPAGQPPVWQQLDPQLAPPAEVFELLQEAPEPPYQQARGNGFVVSLDESDLMIAGASGSRTLPLATALGLGPAYSGTLDAHVLWDPFASRFLMVVLTSPPKGPSLLSLWASDDADPFGRWYTAQVPVQRTGGRLSGIALSQSLLIVTTRSSAADSGPYWVIPGRTGNEGFYDGRRARVEFYGCDGGCRRSE